MYDIKSGRNTLLVHRGIHEAGVDVCYEGSYVKMARGTSSGSFDGSEVLSGGSSGENRGVVASSSTVLVLL